MVDQNGKLFGKINIIDLIIIIVLAALVATLAVRTIHNRQARSQIQKVRITFYTEEVPDYVPKAMQNGAPVQDSTENTDLGKLENFEVGKPLGYVTDTKGQVQAVVRDGYVSLSFVSVANGELTDHGVKINSNTYSVGYTFTVYAGKAKIYCKIKDVELAA